MGLLLNVLQRADATPTGQVVAACKELQKMPTGLLGRWRELRNKELPALNEKPGAAKPPPPPLGGEEKAR